METSTKKAPESEGGGIKAVPTAVICTIAVLGIAAAIIVSLTEAAMQQNYKSHMNRYLYVSVITAFFILQIFLPKIAEKIFKVRFSPPIVCSVILLGLGGTFLGNIMNMYHRFPVWDNLMHIILGITAGLVALGLIQFSLKDGNDSSKPLFISTMVAFSSIATSTLWEVVEFTIDILLDMNAQAYALSTGQLLVGRAALANTMHDTLLNIAGALVVAFFVYFSVKHKKTWHLRFAATLVP